jgi:hypothetical protein
MLTDDVFGAFYADPPFLQLLASLNQRAEQQTFTFIAGPFTEPRLTVQQSL